MLVLFGPLTLTEVFLEEENGDECHSMFSDSNTTIPTIDQTSDPLFSDFDFMNFDINVNAFNGASAIIDNDMIEDSSSTTIVKDCSAENGFFPFSVSSEDDSIHAPNIAIPSGVVDESPANFELLLPVENSPVSVPMNHYYMSKSKDEIRRMEEKKRRMRRFFILKQKRAQGLISVDNCRKVRYHQKQITAFQKNRVNGKFSCNDSIFQYSVCFEINKTFRLHFFYKWTRRFS